jgi:hypothetical protein
MYLHPHKGWMAATLFAATAYAGQTDRARTLLAAAER